MQAYMETAEPVLVDTFILTRALRGPVHVEELGRMLASVDVDWDERVVRARVEQLERTRHLERRGTQLELSEDGRRDAERLLRLWGRLLDEAGVRPTSPPDPRLLNEPEVRSGPAPRPEGATPHDRWAERVANREGSRR